MIRGAQRPCCNETSPGRGWWTARGRDVGNSIVCIHFSDLKAGMASGTVPHLISVVKSEKYALRGVLDFFLGGDILYMRTRTI